MDARQLTHVELLHRPGERDLARQVLTLIGCEPVDRGGHWFTSFVDPAAPRDWATNVVYASEVGAEQWALEQALPTEADRYREAMRREPQKSTHFGFRVPTEAALDEVVERVRTAGRDDPALAGRVAVDGVYRPGEPGAVAETMVQAFVWTDVVAAGLLSLGQHIEIQWHLPAEAA
jgi:hypothetical protein